MNGWDYISNRSTILRKVMHKLCLCPEVLPFSVIQYGYTKNILVFLVVANIDQIASPIVPAYHVACV